MPLRFWPVPMVWALLVVCAAILGTAAQLLGPQAIPWMERHSQRIEVRAMQAGLTIVDVENARAILKAGEYLVFDARRAAEFDAGHLPGAVSFPYESREEGYNEMAALLQPAQPVLVYCSGRECDDALLLGEFLKNQGSQEVSLFLEGTAGWKAAGLTLE
jgi:rhodanese-related sulfurtransferase